LAYDEDVYADNAADLGPTASNATAASEYCPQTLAYDEDAFACNVVNLGPQAATTMAEQCAPTLAYDEDAFAFGAVDLGPPAPIATTEFAHCPATLAYNEDVVVPHAAGRGTAMSVAARTAAQCPETLAYDVDAFVAFRSENSMITSVGQCAATLAYDEEPFVANAEELAPTPSTATTVAQCPPTLAYDEDAFATSFMDIAPTLDYGGDDSVRPDVEHTSPARSIQTAVIDNLSNGLRASEGASASSVPRSNAEPRFPLNAVQDRATDEPLFAASREDISIFAAPEPQAPGREMQAAPMLSLAARQGLQPKRRRLRGKQAAPAHFNTPVVGGASPRAAASSSAASSARAAPEAALATSILVAPPLAAPLRAAEAGTQVIVRGDGWGGGSGEYLATVTEMDAFTYTVIRQFEDGSVEETHILREHCNVVCGPESERRPKRPRRSAAN